MHARLSEFELDTGYLLKETALDEKSVISRSANLRREIEPWNGNFLGNWKLQSPQICFAFQSQASWRSGAGMWSVENERDIFSINSGSLRRKSLRKISRLSSYDTAFPDSMIKKDNFGPKIARFLNDEQAHNSTIGHIKTP